jgi:asparagine synthase (glutamine-hydrolysing)
MSGIAGIVWFDGSPATVCLESMLRQIEHRGGDMEALWNSGNVGMAFAGRWITPEDGGEKQPLQDIYGNVVVFDGRLDYRDELRAALADRCITPTTNTDAALVLCAYRAWGNGAATRIEGDYSLAIFDARAKTLYCVRDRLGLKPFYYAITDRFFAFASEPCALFAVPGLLKRPNRTALVHYLMNYAEEVEQTEFEGVNRLEPGNYLSLEDKRITKGRYWDVDPLQVVTRSDPREYEEEFKRVFTVAVAERARSRGPVGVFFSGGIDSSSVLGVLQHLTQNAGAPMEIKVYSLIFPGKPWDEQPYMNEVLKRGSTDVCWIQQNPPHPVWELGTLNEAAPLTSAMAYTVAALATAAVNDGCRVVLGGIGGDDFLDAPTVLGFDLLRSGRPQQAWKFVREYSDFQNVRFTEACRDAVIFPLRATIIPDWARRIYRRFRPFRAREWMKPEVHDIATAPMRNPPSLPRNQDLPLGRRSAYRTLHSGHLIQAFEHNDRFCTRIGCENPQPFCDRRVVEFAMSVPDAVLARGGRPKGLLRDAMSQYLPEMVRDRRDKAEFTGLFNPYLAEDWEYAHGLLREPVLEGLGIIDGEKARARYEFFRKTYQAHYSGLTAISGRNNILPSDEIWLLLNLEHWLRKTFAEAATALRR